MADSESASGRAKPTFELPVTESPSISPASIESAAEPAAETPAQPAADEISVTVADPEHVTATPQIEIKLSLIHI